MFGLSISQNSHTKKTNCWDLLRVALGFNQNVHNEVTFCAKFSCIMSNLKFYSDSIKCLTLMNFMLWLVLITCYISQPNEWFNPVTLILVWQRFMLYITILVHCNKYKIQQFVSNVQLCDSYFSVPMHKIQTIGSHILTEQGNFSLLAKVMCGYPAEM